MHTWFATRRSTRVGVLALAGAVMVLASTSAISMAGSGTKTPMRTGSRIGPVKIAGTTSGTTVGQLALTAGNWTVFAKGTVGNTSSSSAFHPVSCSLTLAGKTDRVRLSPGRKGTASSSEPFLLTTANHLAGKASARLSCAAPGTSTGTIVAQNLRLTAFRTPTVTLVETGTTFFGSQSSPAQVIHKILPGSVSMGVSSSAMTSISVPFSGPWAFTAKATVSASTGAEALVHCSLAAGDTDRTAIDLAGKGHAGDRRGIVLEMVHNFASAGSATLSCDSSAGSATKIKDVRITAYRASLLRNQDLDGNSVFAASGVFPQVFAGYDDGPIGLGFGSYDTLDPMSLPAGYWTIIGKVFLDPTANVDGPITCQLGAAGSRDTVKLVLGAQNSANDLQPADFLWSGVFPGRTVVTLRCNSATAGVIANWIKLTAYAGSSLQTLSID